MTDDSYRPPLADYFDELEDRYGEAFSFDRLTDSELQEVERLGRDAIEQDPNVTEVEKVNLRPLLMVIEQQQAKRKR